MGISPSVDTIGSIAFTGCTSLRSLTIPIDVTLIHPGTFDNCSSLQSLTIFSNTINFQSERSFGAQYPIFGDCSSLVTIKTYPWNWPKIFEAVNHFQFNPTATYTLLKENLSRIY